MLCKESWMMNKMRLRQVDKPILCEEGHVGTCDFQQMLKIMVRISPIHSISPLWNSEDTSSFRKHVFPCLEICFLSQTQQGLQGLSSLLTGLAF